MHPNPKNWDQKRHPRIIGAFIVSPVRSDKRFNIFESEIAPYS